jgi:Beta-lactamase
LTETEMSTKPAVFSPPSVLGRDPHLFPGVAISFFTDKGDLVPFTQDVIRYSSNNQGRSYWDIIVQSGRVWSQPDDSGWSRAGFPFALVNSIEGETHNGLATFLYKGGRVSNLRFQIVQQTAPYYIKDDFVAAGLVSTAFAPVATDRLNSLKRGYEAARADAVPIASWDELAAKVSGADLANFDGPMRASDIVLSGLDYQGTFYLKGCRSAGGELPWCDRARFGVWSATKALANETALLRLAEKYGPAVFEMRIADYVPEAARYIGWQHVRFEDAINMATGIGNGSKKRQPNDTSDGYLDDASYSRWYEARSTQEKVAALLKDGGVYPWGPGQVTRYRDQDMFILGVAMDRFLKSKEGPTANIWSMLQREVFAPIGIHQAPTNRTIEPDGSDGHPLMAYGYYPTISDMVLIARLYQNNGKHGDDQILYAPRIRELLAGPSPRGFPTGEKLSVGETTYINAFWVTSFASDDCRVFYPRMIGWGGNIVALMPGSLTGIRLAKSGETADHSEVDTSGMAQVANSLSRFCN